MFYAYSAAHYSGPNMICCCDTCICRFSLEKCEALNFFFCFRWLLIWFKREFEWVDIMRLWEVLFSDFLSSQFQLFVAMSILDKHRDVMMDHLQGFDEILKVSDSTSAFLFNSIVCPG